MSLPCSQLPLPLAKRPGAYYLHMHGISQIFRGFMQQQILTVLRYIPRQTLLQEESGSGMAACLGKYNSLFAVLLCKLPVVKTNCFQDRAAIIHVQREIYKCFCGYQRAFWLIDLFLFCSTAFWRIILPCLRSSILAGLCTLNCSWSPFQKNPIFLVSILCFVYEEGKCRNF